MPVEAMTFTRSAETEAQRIACGLRGRDVALLNELVERYQYRLAGYLLYLTGRREFVEDLIQETCCFGPTNLTAEAVLRRGCLPSRESSHRLRPQETAREPGHAGAYRARRKAGGQASGIRSFFA